MTRYGYDAHGNQDTITDTLGHVSRTFYDELDRPIRTVTNYSDGVYDTDRPDEDVVTTFAYDRAG